MESEHKHVTNLILILGYSSSLNLKVKDVLREVGTGSLLVEKGKV